MGSIHFKQNIYIPTISISRAIKWWTKIQHGFQSQIFETIILLGGVLLRHPVFSFMLPIIVQKINKKNGLTRLQVHTNIQMCLYSAWHYTGRCYYQFLCTEQGNRLGTEASSGARCKIFRQPGICQALVNTVYPHIKTDIKLWIFILQYRCFLNKVSSEKKKN